MNAKIRIQNIDIDTSALHAQALEALSNAYVPYSKFSVGAALVDQAGNVHLGANVENASYGLSSCAERNTIFAAKSKGMKHILALYIVGNTQEPISPCGACRQVMREFSTKDTIIFLSNTKGDVAQTTVEELLPKSFGPEHL